MPGNSALLASAGQTVLAIEGSVPSWAAALPAAEPEEGSLHTPGTPVVVVCSTSSNTAPVDSPPQLVRHSRSRQPPCTSAVAGSAAADTVVLAPSLASCYGELLALRTASELVQGDVGSGPDEEKRLLLLPSRSRARRHRRLGCAPFEPSGSFYFLECFPLLAPSRAATPLCPENGRYHSTSITY